MVKKESCNLALAKRLKFDIISAKAIQGINYLIHPAKAGRNSWLPIFFLIDNQFIGSKKSESNHIVFMNCHMALACGVNKYCYRL